MAMVCGIEDAGRGPVIGPLVMAGVLIDEEKETELKRMGVKDSKALNPETREILYKQILGIAEAHAVRILQPEEIDHALKTDYLNLNWLEAIKTGEIINELQPDKVIVDCPSPNCKAYEQYVRKQIKIETDFELLTEHKADVNHVIVAAASIIAKVTRDREIAKIKKKIGVDFGSGYPTDEKTVRFLEAHFEDYPDIFRKEWLPYKAAKNKKYQTTLEKFEKG